MKVKEHMIYVYAVLVPGIWLRRRKALSSRRSNAPGTPTEGP